MLCKERQCSSQVWDKSLSSGFSLGRLHCQGWGMCRHIPSVPEQPRHVQRSLRVNIPFLIAPHRPVAASNKRMGCEEGREKRCSSQALPTLELFQQLGDETQCFYTLKCSFRRSCHRRENRGEDFSGSAEAGVCGFCHGCKPRGERDGKTKPRV